MSLDECLARACEHVPGLFQGALALLPEGLLIGGLGEGGAFDREPLVRSAARCLNGTFVEHVFVSREDLVVIARGRRFPRLALALACRTDANLNFVVTASRTALRELEATLDPGSLEI